MFTVECPGCSGSYQVDERRVPASGLRMRCPKCSTAFIVEKPTDLQEPSPPTVPDDLPARAAKSDLPAPLVAPKVPPAPKVPVVPTATVAAKASPAFAAKPVIPPRTTAGTQGVGALGAAPPHPAPPSRTAAGGGAVVPPRPAPPRTAAGGGTSGGGTSGGGAAVPPRPTPPRAAAAGGAPPRPAPVAPTTSSLTDAGRVFQPRGPAGSARTNTRNPEWIDETLLPAVAPSGGGVTPSRSSGAPEGEPLSPETDLELPALVRRRTAITQPVLPATPMSGQYDSDSDLPAALNSKPTRSVPSTKPVIEQRTEQRAIAEGKRARSLDLDLPAVTDSVPLPDLVDAALPELDRREGDVGLPALGRRDSEFPDVEPRETTGRVPTAKRPRSSDELELDLPSPAEHFGRGSKTESVPPLVDDFEFDLPSPRTAQKETLGAGDASRRDFSLPEVSGVSAGGAGLPALDVGLPDRARNDDLGLPAIGGAFGASTKTLAGAGPSIAGGRASSASASMPPAEIPELDLGWGHSPSSPPGGGLTNSIRGSFPPSTSGGSRSSVSEPPGLGLEGSSASVSLPPMVGSAKAPTISYRQDTKVDVAEMELLIEPTSLSSRRSSSSSIPPATPRDAQPNGASVGGTSYGEVSLEAEEEPISVEMEAGTASPGRNSSDALEFGAVPQAVEEAPVPSSSVTKGAAATDGRAAMARGPLTTSVRERRATRKPLLAVVGVAIIGGIALSFVPDVGPFGAYFIVDQVNSKNNQAIVRKHVDAGRAVLARDDFSGVEQVLRDVERERRAHERLRSLAAYEAYFGYMAELRHGAQAEIRARAQVTLNELGERPELPYFGLAQAARAAVEGNLARARRTIDGQLARDPRNVEILSLSADIARLERRQSEALQQWQTTEKLSPTARTAFGLARTLLALGRFDEADKWAHQALARNPNHVGAELLLARLAFDVRHDTEESFRLAQSALRRSEAASISDFVQAQILSGDVHFSHSRISLAESSYQEALAKDPKSASALRGLGETLYRAGRYSEALARFEAGLQSSPDNVDTAVGVAKSQLALERVREALALLSRLRQTSPKSYPVNYWYARANEAGGNRDEAEKAYESAIDVGGTDPVVVDAYVGLALVKNQQGRREEAQKVLAKAQEKLPKLSRIFDALGQLALAEGRYDSAIEQFKAALELSPGDVGVKFRLGVAQRKNRDFEAATRSFDEVAVIDRDYPGLALERGQLFESSGRTAEALLAFESALAKAPTDPDLMLRVGCGKVIAGRPEQAEELLKKVLEQRPMSAETHHCLGRAQLLQGSNLALALRTLERAVELDPHRAEYLLYVGWAANEAGDIAKAEQALKKALELDQGLGDAYWQRGILRYRQGAVKDAVTDLTRAIELRPGRYEAHAALADAYYDLGLEAKALDEWFKATTAQPDNATWAFRYGKLLQSTHREADAKALLEKSIELANKLPVKPRWIWEAHHLLARAIGHQPAAVNHWQSFLELSPRDNVYREEAKQALSKLGHPWTGD